MTTNHLANEWKLLQKQCEDYEKYSLLIKLIAIILLAVTLLVQPGNELAIAAVIGVLWLQDAIWKTFQHRIETRLHKLEGNLAATEAGNNTQSIAYQLHSEFLAKRHNSGVFQEYLTQAVRPTVAFPYVALWAVLLLAMFFSS